MAKMAFLELLVACLLAPRDLVCRHQAQRPGSLQGPGPLPTAPLPTGSRGLERKHC